MRRKTIIVTACAMNEQEVLKAITSLYEKYGLNIDIEISRLTLLDSYMITVMR